VQIANPIYDVVFKYLMEDEKSAEILISSIIDEEIISLELSPQEKTYQLDKPPLTVYRLDFSAKIKTDTGYKKIVIEIQKAKFATDIMRFRRYLGEQYKDKANTYKIENNRKKRQAIPIVTIYFLGYSLDHINAPIIKIARNYYDKTTGKKIHVKEDFIESLTHDSYIIQIPHLNDTVQTETEKLLSVFNQKFITSDEHILSIDELDYPKAYRFIIRRLQRAVAEKEVRDKMEIEDDYLEELQDKERIIDEKNKVINDNKKALTEKDRVLTEKDRVLTEKDIALDEKNKIIDELKKELSRQKKS
jgi:hypothetical protein